MCASHWLALGFLANTDGKRIYTSCAFSCSFLYRSNSWFLHFLIIPDTHTENAIPEAFGEKENLLNLQIREFHIRKTCIEVAKGLKTFQ